MSKVQAAIDHMCVCVCGGGGGQDTSEPQATTGETEEIWICEKQDQVN